MKYSELEIGQDCLVRLRDDLSGGHVRDGLVKDRAVSISFSVDAGGYILSQEGDAGLITLMVSGYSRRDTELLEHLNRGQLPRIAWLVEVHDESLVVQARSFVQQLSWTKLELAVDEEAVKRAFKFNRSLKGIEGVIKWLSKECILEDGGGMRMRRVFLYRRDGEENLMRMMRSGDLLLRVKRFR